MQPFLRISLVEYLRQKQTRRRGGKPGRQLGTRGQHGLHIDLRQISPTDFNKNTRHATHHLPEKMRPCHPEDDQVAYLLNAYGVNQNFRRSILFQAPVGKRSKIMKTMEQLAGFFHFSGIQGVFDPPDVTFAEGGPDPGKDIDIDPRYGVMAGVKIGSGLFHLKDVDACGQQIIQSLPDFPGLLHILYGEMYYLTQGMDAGIRSSRPLDIHVLAEELDRRLDQRPLDRPGVLLGLPSPIARAVIFQSQFVFHHSSQRFNSGTGREKLVFASSSNDGQEKCFIEAALHILFIESRGLYSPGYKRGLSVVKTTYFLYGAKYI